MSENGPREGTRDLPRRDPDSGRRAVEASSPAGHAYEVHARQEHRRARDILRLAEEGLSPEAIVIRYGQDHPAERPATVDEVLELVGRSDAARGSRRRAP
ncbi:MAG TPA: hypothetical protein VEL82_05360 [Thermoplasmata archaeon]|nr:hypothetical protein [Thermoplasmata archaeon]